MTKKFISSFILIALLVLMLPTSGVGAKNPPMPPAGNANLRAIDISQYNVPRDSSGNYQYDKLDWPAIRSNVDLMYIRASIKNISGNLQEDNCFKVLATSAMKAGISHGFYHYFRPSTKKFENVAQADFFYNTIKNYAYDLVPVLDVETAQDYDGKTLTKAQITQAVRDFADEFKKKSGQDIMIYTYNNFVNNYLDASLSKYKLWLANYTADGPFVTNVWNSWDMWQYTDSLKVAGLPYAVDGDKSTPNVYLSSVSGMTWIDYPKGTYGVGDITVSGWAISHYGVKRVDIYVDGKGLGSVRKENFTQRSDIQNKFAGQGYDDTLNSGYKFTIPDGKLDGGTHTIRVAAVDYRGNAVWSAAKTFNINIPKNQIGLEKPSGTYAGNVPVSGWALSAYGVGRVDIYVDGKALTSIENSSFTKRGDIAKKFANQGYADLEKCGFSYTIKDGTLAGGKHTVRAAMVDKKGKTLYSQTNTITVNVPKDLVRLDNPKGTFTGNIPVSGWAVSNFGVKRVDVYVDGKGFGSVSYDSLTKRNDISRIYANSRYHDLEHSGFSYTIQSGRLSAGTHTVRVAVINQKGGATWSSTATFTVKIPANLMHIDKPSGTYTGSVPVSGWALSYYGVKRVDVYIDGKGFGSVRNDAMTERTDVERVYAGKGYSDTAHSGFSYTVAEGRLSKGTHSVRVAMIDKSGNVLWSSPKTFTVK